MDGFKSTQIFKIWRTGVKRQLMALATVFYSTNGDTTWDIDAKRDWLDYQINECDCQGDVNFFPVLHPRRELSRNESRGRWAKG